MRKQEVITKQKSFGKMDGPDWVKVWKQREDTKSHLSLSQRPTSYRPLLRLTPTVLRVNRVFQ